jgi:hypothetical protein
MSSSDKACIQSIRKGLGLLHSQLSGVEPGLERGKDQPDTCGGRGQDPTELKEVGSMANGLARGPVLVGYVRQLQSDLGSGGFCAQVEYCKFAHFDRVEGPSCAGAEEVGDSEVLRARHTGKFSHAGSGGVG